jgi:hypothetical protein
MRMLTARDRVTVDRIDADRSAMRRFSPFHISPTRNYNF